MQKRTFRPLTPDDIPWLRRCRNTADHPFTALSAVSLMTWAETYGLSVTGDDDFFVIRSRYDDAYYSPVGDPEKCGAFIEEAGKESPARFVYVAEPLAKKLSAEGWHVHFRADLSEYITSSAALAMIPPNAISESFRRKCRSFSRAFGEYRVTPVSAENMELLWDTADRYLAAQTVMPSDQAVLRTELDRFEELQLQGILLTMPDGRKAFILGYENTPDTFTMTMTRHDPTLPPEITAVCIHAFADLLRRKYPLIDVEEDMGLDGLRRSKLLMSPVDLLKAYEVFR